MKQLFLIVALTINFCAFSQDDKTVTLVVSGQGKTQDEAKQNALRNAIEQAFGTFISSKTEILNDDLVKDEIVSVTNGNVQKFEILSEVMLANNGYASTLKVTVSVTKLTTFVESRGVVSEFRGELFAFNILHQQMNEKSEIEALKNILETSNELLKKSFDYYIELKGNPVQNNNKFDIPVRISARINNNFYNFRKYFIESLEGLSMNDSDVQNYHEINKNIGQLIIRRDTIFSQESLLITKNYTTNNNGPRGFDEWKFETIEMKNYNDKYDKIFFYDDKFTDKYGYVWDPAYADGKVYSINTNLEFKEAFESRVKKNKFRIFMDQHPLRFPAIVYKVHKNDLGYSKIYFRNNSSLNLIDNFLRSIYLNILKFEVLNEVERNQGIDIINRKGFKVQSDFNIVLRNQLNKANLTDPFSMEDYPNTNFLDLREQYERNIYLFSNSDNQVYFPNLLSIWPIKKTSKAILISFSKYKIGDEVVQIEYMDSKSVEDLKNISGYKIKTIE